MHHQRHDVLAAVPGTCRQIHSFHYGPAPEHGKIYIQASLHADELPGMLVIWHLKQRMLELEQAGLLRKHIVLVPVANPMGLGQLLRIVPADGQHMGTQRALQHAGGHGEDQEPEEHHGGEQVRGAVGQIELSLDVVRGGADQVDEAHDEEREHHRRDFYETGVAGLGGFATHFEFPFSL
mgnify:CR=1 FL=1